LHNIASKACTPQYTQIFIELDMKKIFRRIGLLLLLIGLIAGIVKAVLVYGNLEPIKVLLSKMTPAKAPAVQAKIPDFRELAMQQGGTLEPTEAQLKEEKAIENSQVATAGQWLASANAQQRHDGAEQLSAYPTVEAEKMLLKALSSDADPAVRSTAAESLSAFETLSAEAITGLLAAMDDDNQNVQFNALSTLQNQVANEENNSKRYQMIMRGLKKKLKSTHLSEEMRNTVRGFIDDQQPS
jgi:hypothetical protein